MSDSGKSTMREFDTEIEVKASTQKVWRAISEGPELSRWFAPEATVEPAVGGEILWKWEGMHEWSQRVEIWEPGKRLRTRYDSAVDDGKGGKVPLFIDFQIEARDGGRTALRIVQSGFGPDASFDAEYDGISRGWPLELQSLRVYLENHFGSDRKVVWKRCHTGMDDSRAWQLLLGPDGLGREGSVDGKAEGDDFALTTANGDEFRGVVVHHTPDHDFGGIVHNFGNAFFRIAIEACGGGPVEAHLILNAWGMPEEAVHRVGASFENLLTGLFPETAATASSVGGSS